ncbi:hypothetical protein J2Z40_000249 [Cytobacillus eiseniae]|uniref:Uncharacterized protein n=1 Tax=Cytobacillus eiseniae TaxID=762947 RepID=A0ABS4RBC7_9BACI|nr:hypothetical protein [Cytobacillus eiseniae]MBP2239696.1 hypothetical protein [Cytobacillus eiseniae]
MQNKPGNRHLPDFKELNDRVIAEKSKTEPILVIKTNEDPKDSTVDNPYFQEGRSNEQEFRAFFENT